MHIWGFWFWFYFILHWRYKVLKHIFIKNRLKRTCHNKNDKYCEAQLVKSNKHSYLINPLNSLHNGNTQVKWQLRMYHYDYGIHMPNTLALCDIIWVLEKHKNCYFSCFLIGFGNGNITTTWQPIENKKSFSTRNADTRFWKNSDDITHQ